MYKHQLLQICSKLGINLIENDGILREEKGYYENYSQLESGGVEWYYSEVNFETRTKPEKENIAKFTDEKNAIKYFFLKILKKFYFKKVHIPNNPIRNIHTIEGVKEYFQSLGIEDQYYSFSVIRPQAVYAEIESDKIKISFIDVNMRKKFTTMPLEYERGFFAMYRLTYYLYLLKKLESSLIEKNILEEKFDDNDIELFVK